MRAGGKPPETDREYYRRRLSEIGRRVFEVGTGAAFFYFVDWVIHTLLKLVQIPDHALPGRAVHRSLDWMVGIGYVIYCLRLLLPDASEQVAEMREQIVHHWHGSAGRKKKP